ncbi:MAG TPA: hypothetical protein VJS13_04945 [Pyrinomonadaceae bacterium]|nr:hypothetical protein [Pyrinomonadaceae bacterium]
MSKRTLGAFMLVLACAVSTVSQETTSTTQQTTTTTSQQSTTQTTQSTTTQDYVFPSHDERFKRYLKSTIGPFSLVRTGVSAGLNQWNDSPEEWGQGMKGYGKRYASGFGRNAIQQTVTYGLDEAFHLDTGFERSKRDGFGARLKDALLQNVTSRTRSGKRVISAPRFVGVYTGAIIAHETWYPERYSYKDGLRSGSMTLLTGFGINLFREFVVNW